MVTKFERSNISLISAVLLAASIVMSTFTVLATQVVNELAVSWENDNTIFNSELANVQVSINQNNGMIDPDLTKREGSNKRAFQVWVKNGIIENNKEVSCIMTSTIDNNFRKFDCTHVLQKANHTPVGTTTVFRIPVRANHITGPDKNIRLRMTDDANNSSNEIVKPIKDRSGANLRYNNSRLDATVPTDSSPVIEGLERVGSSSFRVARLGTMHTIALADGSRKDVTRVEYDVWTQDYQGVAWEMERFINARAYDYSEYVKKGELATPLSSVQIQPYSTNPKDPNRFKFKVIWDPVKVIWNGNNLLPQGAELEGPYIVANYAMPHKSRVPNFATPGQAETFVVGLKTGNFKLTYSDGSNSRIDFNGNDNVRKFVVPPGGGFSHHTFPYTEVYPWNNAVDWTYSLPLPGVNPGELMKTITGFDPKGREGKAGALEGYGTNDKYYVDTYFTERRDIYDGTVLFDYAKRFDFSSGEMEIYYTTNPCTLDGTQWRRNTTDGTTRNRTTPKVNLCGKANGFDITGDPATGWKKVENPQTVFGDNFYANGERKYKELGSEHRFPSRDKAKILDATGIRVVFTGPVVKKMFQNIPGTVLVEHLSVVSDRNIRGGTYIGSWASYSLGQPKEHSPLCVWDSDPNSNICNKNMNTRFTGEWWGVSSDAEQIRSFTSELSGMSGLQLLPGEKFNIEFNPTIPGQRQRGITTSTLVLTIPAGISIDTNNITVNGQPFDGTVTHNSGNIATDQEYTLTTTSLSLENSNFVIPAVNTVHSPNERIWTLSHRISGAGVNPNNKRIIKDRIQVDGNVSSWSGTIIASTTYSANVNITNKHKAITEDRGYNNTWMISVEKNYGDSTTLVNDTTDSIVVIPYTNDGNSSIHSSSKIDVLSVDNITGGTGTVYYTTASPNTINRDPAHQSNQLNGGIWSQNKPADGTTITGVRMVTTPENKAGKVTFNINYKVKDPINDNTLAPIVATRLANSPLKVYADTTTPILSPNTKPKVDGNIRLAKMSSLSIGTGNNTLLGGSKFTLKEIRTRGNTTFGIPAHEDPCSPDSINSGLVDPDDCNGFTMTVEDTDGDGVLDFTGVPTGKMFELIEEKAPNGYAPLPERILFNYTDSKEIVLVGNQTGVSVTTQGDDLYNASNNANLVVFDTPAGTLPNTGGNLVIWMIALSTIISSVAIASRKRTIL